MWMDLHTHTTCSDGQYTPEELVQKAVESGVRVLAITDHDAVSGVGTRSKGSKGISRTGDFFRH